MSSRQLGSGSSHGLQERFPGTSLKPALVPAGQACQVHQPLRVWQAHQHHPAPQSSLCHQQWTQWQHQHRARLALTDKLPSTSSPNAASGSSIAIGSASASGCSCETCLMCASIIAQGFAIATVSSHSLGRTQSVQSPPTQQLNAFLEEEHEDESAACQHWSRLLRSKCRSLRLQRCLSRELGMSSLMSSSDASCWHNQLGKQKCSATSLQSRNPGSLSHHCQECRRSPPDGYQSSPFTQRAGDAALDALDEQASLEGADWADSGTITWTTSAEPGCSGRSTAAQHC